MTQALLLQYIGYLGAILVGLVILALIKHCTKLPTHSELKKRLLVLRDELKGFAEVGKSTTSSGYEFFKRSSHCMYSANRLAYTVTLMSQKEQDGNLSDIAVTLEEIRSKLAPYRFKTKGKDDLGNLLDALDLSEKTVRSIESILERDKDLKAKHLRY